jgi:PKD repeat protein
MQQRYRFLIVVFFIFVSINPAVAVVDEFSYYGGTASAQDTTGVHTAALLFDNDPATGWWSGIFDPCTPNWIQMDFNATTTHKVTKYVMTARGESASAESPKDWFVQGSNDGSTWTNIDNRTGVLFTSGETKTYDSLNLAANQSMFRYYRMRILKTNYPADYAWLYEWELWGEDTLPATTPVANFTINLTSVMYSQPFYLNDTSTNIPTVQNYSFVSTSGGTKTWLNGTASAQNVTTMFSTGGNYTIQLYSQNTAGGNYSAWKQYIDVWNWSPASFTGTPQMGANPLSVTFSGSSNNATDYYWQFGDSSTDTVQNPTHIYTADGTYNVNYRTKNAYHTGNWSNATGYIQVNITLSSDFSGAPTVGYAPLTVNFVDMSSGDGLYYWEWDFGDTGTSLLRNPSHTYTTSGAFNVKLTAKGSDGTAVTTKNGYINVLYPFSKYTDPLGYILANGADNKIHFYDFKNATDGEYVEIIISGSYEVP